ncbi:nuclear transport factor 2 family protein [Microbacterium schleiferi]|uniref:Nuclear transport factor 2 family protein n=1 Tax=Microbacterium schleiferi TaxID=69362 RepID=A0A7S8RHW9_9MICO|nr:nuclear transport factor 2 family protein [Microbacterium schleiferi]QPE05551.1 nuclear transport factor 2 family protein [Microbacterium schleiferi]
MNLDVTSPDAVSAVVRRYFAVVGDLDSTEDQLRAVVDPDAVFRELPNPIAPSGHERSLEQAVAGFLSGKSRLTDQRIDVHEILVSGHRAAVRSTWRGVLGGTEIVAHMAGFVTVRDGLVASHETYDCYEPFTLSP